MVHWERFPLKSSKKFQKIKPQKGINGSKDLKVLISKDVIFLLMDMFTNIWRITLNKIQVRRNMWFIKWNSYFCKNVGHNNTSITVGEWVTSLRRVFGLKNATSRGPHSTLSISNNRLLENICSTVDVQHFIAQWKRLPNSKNCEMRGVAFCKRAKEFCFITCLHFYFTFVIIHHNQTESMANGTFPSLWILNSPASWPIELSINKDHDYSRPEKRFSDFKVLSSRNSQNSSRAAISGSIIFRS